ncbi:hypothetical protein L1987_30493 [Smallanthus sonchifolius]|uniref:Uncharacterized protein n=1 Tax=Smallanthus sonchifolius TaxID=185202 RepID=A0ACB9I4G4_9ASTR|nr:hypothetical protein L1987_30493 [Smallanthus sonchifolius]
MPFRVPRISPSSTYSNRSTSSLNCDAASVERESSPVKKHLGKKKERICIALAHETCEEPKIRMRLVMMMLVVFTNRWRKSVS